MDHNEKMHGVIFLFITVLLSFIVMLCIVMFSLCFVFNMVVISSHYSLFLFYYQYYYLPLDDDLSLGPYNKC